MNNNRILLPAFLVLAGLAGGCGDSEPAKSPSDVSSTSAQSPATTPAPQPMTAPAPDPMPATAPVSTPAPAPAKLSDGDILAITSVANNGEIDMAKVAQTNAQNAQVKSFAAMMIKEHTDAETKGKKLAKTANITPTDNEMSTKLKSDGQATISDLKAQKGAAFDKAYMDSQVKAHKDVLAAFDDKLIPNAQNADLKTLLSEVRTHVQHHLDKAQEINDKLGDTGRASTPMTGAKPAMKPTK